MAGYMRAPKTRVVTRVIYRRAAHRAKGTMWSRLVHTVSTRPLKIIAAGLGVAAAVTPAVIVNPSTGNSVVGHTMAGIAAMQAGGETGASNAAYNFSSIPAAYVNGVMSGGWLVPAAGAAVLAIISRKFKV